MNDRIDFRNPTSSLLNCDFIHLHYEWRSIYCNIFVVRFDITYLYRFGIFVYVMTVQNTKTKKHMLES